MNNRNQFKLIAQCYTYTPSHMQHTNAQKRKTMHQAHNANFQMTNVICDKLTNP